MVKLIEYVEMSGAEYYSKPHEVLLTSKPNAFFPKGHGKYFRKSHSI